MFDSQLQPLQEQNFTKFTGHWLYDCVYFDLWYNAYWEAPYGPFWAKRYIRSQYFKVPS